MSEWITLEKSFLGYPLSVRVCPLGADYAVIISGGCRPHVGSVTAAYWENGAVRCETSVRQGHHDDVVSKRFAQELAQACQCSVSVNCGIHYDNLSKADLACVLAGTEELLARLIGLLACPAGGS